MNRADYYQRHLDKVSRSFAFCIARLPDPLREQVALAYLLCRVLDCVEDANWLGQEQQLTAFLQFENFVTSRHSSEAIHSWRARFPNLESQFEDKLLDDAPILFEDFHRQLPEVRRVLTNPIISMARGMTHFAEKKKRGELRLRTLRGLNQYCFFVAGVVGEILSGLVELQNVNQPKEDLENAIHFGLFLQKINILKDQLDDERHGRFFIPSRETVKQSLELHAQKAFHYISRIPQRMTGFRLFCSWSLFVGLASIPWIEKSWTTKKSLKIPRLQTQKLLWEVEKKIDNDSELSQVFDRLKQVAAEHFGHDSESVEFAKEKLGDELSRENFSRLYFGDLSEKQLSKLGVTG